MTDRDPYLAIMAAADAGRGVNLSHAEVLALSDDDAIATAACNRRAPATLSKPWRRVDPRRDATKAPQ